MGTLAGTWDRSPGSSWEKAEFHGDQAALMGAGFREISPGGCRLNGRESWHRAVRERSRLWYRWPWGQPASKNVFQDVACCLCSSHGGTRVLRCVRKMSSSDLPLGGIEWNPGAPTPHGASRLASRVLISSPVTVPRGLGFSCALKMELSNRRCSVSDPRLHLPRACHPFPCRLTHPRWREGVASIPVSFSPEDKFG